MIIDTDPGADDVVALLLAMASPEDLNIRAITTVAGNVRLDKTSRNARLAREWAGREDIPVYAGAGRPLVRKPIYADDIHGREGLEGVKVHEPKQGLAQGNAVQYRSIRCPTPSLTASPWPCSVRRPTWPWR